MSYAAAVPPRAHGIMFHHLHGGRHERRQGSVTAAQLETAIDFVAASSALLDAGEWLARARAGRLGPRDVCLTFDDGLRCQLELALPVLERRGIAAFFFVYGSVLEGEVDRLELYAHFRHAFFASMADFYRAFDDAVAASPGGAEVTRALAAFDPATYLTRAPFYSDADRRFRYLRDRLLGPDRFRAVMESMIGDRIADRRALAARLSMAEDDVRRLAAAGHVVGMHSHSHPTDIRRLDAAAQREEYRRNRDHLAALLGAPPVCVAHPCGVYDRRTLEILRRLGVEVGFRADLDPGGGGPLEHPRQDHANVMRMLRAASR